MRGLVSSDLNESHGREGAANQLTSQGRPSAVAVIFVTKKR